MKCHFLHQINLELTSFGEVDVKLANLTDAIIVCTSFYFSIAIALISPLKVGWACNYFVSVTQSLSCFRVHYARSQLGHPRTLTSDSVCNLIYVLLGPGIALITGLVVFLVSGVLDNDRRICEHRNLR